MRTNFTTTLSTLALILAMSVAAVAQDRTKISNVATPFAFEGDVLYFFDSGTPFFWSANGSITYDTPQSAVKDIIPNNEFNGKDWDARVIFSGNAEATARNTNGDDKYYYVVWENGSYVLYKSNGDTISHVFAEPYDPPQPKKAYLQIFDGFFEEYFIEYHKPIYREYKYGTLVSAANKLNVTLPQGVKGEFLNNGMPYLEITKDALLAGITIGIAESNKSGGNSISAAWNTPVGKFYNVQLVGNQIIVDSELPGFGVVLSDKAFNGNPVSDIKHNGQTVYNVQKWSKDNTIFLFFHIGSANWFDYDDIIDCTIDYTDGPFYDRPYTDEVTICVFIYQGENLVASDTECKTTTGSFESKVFELDPGTYTVALHVNYSTEPYFDPIQVELEAGDTIVEYDFGNVYFEGKNEIICSFCN